MNENCEHLNTTVIGGDVMLLRTSHNNYQQKLDESSFVDSKLVNSARQQHSQRLMTITEENDNQLTDSNGITNQKSSYYYDNIIKSKMDTIHNNTTAVTQDIFTPAISKDQRDYEHHSQKTPLQVSPHEQSFAVDENRMNHRNEIEQCDQIMQFPTPNDNMLMNKSDHESFEQVQRRLKRVNLSSLNEIDDNLPKETKTFYDGRKCWTSLPADQT